MVCPWTWVGKRIFALVGVVAVLSSWNYSKFTRDCERVNAHVFLFLRFGFAAAATTLHTTEEGVSWPLLGSVKCLDVLSFQNVKQPVAKIKGHEADGENHAWVFIDDVDILDFGYGGFDGRCPLFQGMYYTRFIACKNKEINFEFMWFNVYVDSPRWPRYRRLERLVVP